MSSTKLLKKASNCHLLHMGSHTVLRGSVSPHTVLRGSVRWEFASSGCARPLDFDSLSNWGKSLGSVEKLSPQECPLMAYTVLRCSVRAPSGLSSGKPLAAKTSGVTYQLNSFSKQYRQKLTLDLKGTCKLHATTADSNTVIRGHIMWHSFNSGPHDFDSVSNCGQS